MSDTSVVLATYNGARFLQAQLDSIRAQTLLPAELIAWDDGSTDNTVEILRQFRETVSFPVIIQENKFQLGPANNFLHAANTSSRAYISFCDQDDVWHPEKLYVCQSILDRTGAALCAHSARLIDEAGCYIGTYKQGIRVNKLFGPLELPPWGVFAGFSTVIRRDLMKLINFEKRGPDVYYHDTDLLHDRFYYFLSTTFCHTAVTDRFLADYRQHDRNATGRKSGNVVARISTSIGQAAHVKLRRRQIASIRSSQCRAIARANDSEPLGEVALNGSNYWRRIAVLEAGRLSMYRRKSLYNRITMLVKLIRYGCYNTYRARGLGLGLLVKDILVGMLRVRPLKL